MATIAALTAGSILGGLSRYFLATFIYRLTGMEFPWGTLIVNLTGCLFVGFLSAAAEQKFGLGHNARLLLMTGFCGAYTTFSTLMLETGNLVKDGQIFPALMNIFVSVLFGFLFFRAGVWIGEII